MTDIAFPRFCRRWLDDLGQTRHLMVRISAGQPGVEADKVLWSDVPISSIFILFLLCFEALKNLVDNDIVQPYPPLCDAKGSCPSDSGLESWTFIRVWWKIVVLKVEMRSNSYGTLAAGESWRINLCTREGTSRRWNTPFFFGQHARRYQGAQNRLIIGAGTCQRHVNKTSRHGVHLVCLRVAPFLDCTYISYIKPHEAIISVKSHHNHIKQMFTQAVCDHLMIWIDETRRTAWPETDCRCNEFAHEEQDVLLWASPSQTYYRFSEPYCKGLWSHMFWCKTSFPTRPKNWLWIPLQQAITSTFFRKEVSGTHWWQPGWG